MHWLKWHLGHFLYDVWLIVFFNDLWQHIESGPWSYYDENNHCDKPAYMFCFKYAYDQTCNRHGAHKPLRVSLAPFAILRCCRGNISRYKVFCTISNSYHHAIKSNDKNTIRIYVAGTMFIGWMQSISRMTPACKHWFSSFGITFFKIAKQEAKHPTPGVDISLFWTLCRHYTWHICYFAWY